MAQTLTIECLRPGNGAYFVSNRYDARRAEGFPGAGPADTESAALGNWLLVQAPTTPCLELTLTGGRWCLSGTGQFALAGAEMEATLDGRPCPINEVHPVDNESLLLELKAARVGMRTYLTARGDWSATVVQPNQALRPGWTATVRSNRTTSHQSEPIRSDRFQTASLLAYPGPEWELLSEGIRRWLLTDDFRLIEGNRQGLRFQTSRTPALNLPPLLSSPVLPGTVQLTPAGPVILGPAAHTVGGYPRALVLDDIYLGVAYQRPFGTYLDFRLAE